MLQLLNRYGMRLVTFTGIVLALGLQAASAATPVPEIPKARASVSETRQCVEPVDEMRKNHMNYILHQRDETMHRGIRTRQYSLEECINCHAVTGPDGEFVRTDSGEHFCSSCHNYASVRIDCFQCHADRPTRESTLPQLGGQSAVHRQVPAVTQHDTRVFTAEGRLQ